MQQSHFI